MPHIRTVAAAVAAALALPAAASAHVTLQPSTAPADGFTRLDVRVPNERDDAATVKVDVQLPPGFAFVSYEPRPGWKVAVERGKAERADRGRRRLRGRRGGPPDHLVGRPHRPRRVRRLRALAAHAQGRGGRQAHVQGAPDLRGRRRRPLDRARGRRRARPDRDADGRRERRRPRRAGVRPRHRGLVRRRRRGAEPAGGETGSARPRTPRPPSRPTAAPTGSPSPRSPSPSSPCRRLAAFVTARRPKEDPMRVAVVATILALVLAAPPPPTSASSPTRPSAAPPSRARSSA